MRSNICMRNRDGNCVSLLRRDGKWDFAQNISLEVYGRKRLPGGGYVCLLERHGGHALCDSGCATMDDFVRVPIETTVTTLGKCM